MAHPIDSITIVFIPHADQRYDTVGDWTHEGNELRIRVSRTADARHEQLVAVHELVEALACNVDGVSQETVDAFDMGPGTELDDPGDAPEAPYHSQHVLATIVETRVAAGLHVDWEEYETALDALGEGGTPSTS